jgi:hypothetical protein
MTGWLELENIRSTFNERDGIVRTQTMYTYDRDMLLQLANVSNAQFTYTRDQIEHIQSSMNVPPTLTL